MIRSVGSFVPPSVRTGALFCAMTAAVTALFIKVMQRPLSQITHFNKALIVICAAFVSAKVTGIALPIFVTIGGVAVLSSFGYRRLQSFLQNQKLNQEMDQAVKKFIAKERDGLRFFRYPIATAYIVQIRLGLFDEKGNALDTKPFIIGSSDKSSGVIDRVQRLLPSDQSSIDDGTVYQLWQNRVRFAILSTKDVQSQNSLTNVNTMLDQLKTWPREVSVHFEGVDYQIIFGSIQDMNYSSAPPLPEKLLKIFQIILSERSAIPWQYVRRES